MVRHLFLKHFTIQMLNQRYPFLNKTRTSKVGAISKTQKAQNIFFGKKLEIFENYSLSENVAQCRKI